MVLNKYYWNEKSKTHVSVISKNFVFSCAFRFVTVCICREEFDHFTMQINYVKSSTMILKKKAFLFSRSRIMVAVFSNWVLFIKQQKRWLFHARSKLVSIFSLRNWPDFIDYIYGLNCQFLRLRYLVNSWNYYQKAAFLRKIT